MFWNFKVYIYWVFCWIKIIHQTRNIYPVELINGIVNVLVKFIMYWFLSFFFMIYHYYLVYWCLPIPLHYWLFLPSLTKVQDKIWLTEVHHWFSNAMEAYLQADLSLLGSCKGYGCSTKCQAGTGETTEQSGDTRLYVCTPAVGKLGNIPSRDKGSRAHVCVHCICSFYTFYRGSQCLSTVLCSIHKVQDRCEEGTSSMQMLHRR